MAAKADKKGVDEVGVLFSELEIGGYKIKPWSFGRFTKVYPSLMGLVPALKAMGINNKNALEVFREKAPEIFQEILPTSFPAIRSIIAETLEIPETEVDEMLLQRVMIIVLAIFSQNIGQIKNSLPLIMAQFQAMIGGA